VALRVEDCHCDALLDSKVLELWIPAFACIGAAKPGDDVRPVFIYKRFVSHPTGESQTIPRRKTISAPMGVRRDD
jgi:hypothetical protein